MIQCKYIYMFIDNRKLINKILQKTYRYEND